MTRLELQGRRFGMLVVNEAAESRLTSSGAKGMWRCRCDCGNESIVETSKLTSGHTKSCGCLRRIIGSGRSTHGKRDSYSYKTWASMFQRCENKRNPSYPKYGGRGIKVCREWESFSTFVRDMGDRPSPRHTIERRDVNGDYCPSNCYWTDDHSMQAFNQNRKSNNTSGKSGVYWRKDRSRWVAKIFQGGKTVMLGSFKNREDAIACRKVAEVEAYGKEKSDE